MSLDSIKTQLNTEFAAIAGLKAPPADLPNLAPSSPDTPTIILDYADPFLVTTVRVNNVLIYQWRFEGRFLLSPDGVSTTADVDAALESWPKLVIDKLYSTLKGNNTWTLVADTVTFRRGADYKGEHYHGFTFSFEIHEDVTTTIGV